MSDQQVVLALEAGAEYAMRAGDTKTWMLLSAEALKARFNPELTERETRGAEGSEWPPRPRSVNFECDVDESAGMAEVTELHGYSRKAAPPCV